MKITKYLNMLTNIFRYLGICISPLTEKWYSVYRKVKYHEGRKASVVYMKQLNTIGERYALHQRITPLSFRKSDSEGLPKDLYPFRAYLRGSILKRIAALSVLRSCEILRLPISRDISTVTEPCCFEQDFVDDLINFIPQWLKSIGITSLRSKLPRIKYHMTMKNGPNGSALWTSDSDVGAILDDPRLFEAIQTVQDGLDDRIPLNDTFLRKEGGIHSKLTQFPEKSGKTRTIAIIDYYSQRCLKPLHSALMSTLQSLESDGTYSHQNVGKYAKEKTKEKSFISCFDLSAFTDRFPSVIQRELLLALFPGEERLASAFWTLLAERQFTVAWSGDKVSYQCGQPMGAYASWPLCSLAHHLLIEYCGRYTKSIKTKYRMIGDDLIVTDEQTSQNYQNACRSLGININFDKTVVSEAHRRKSTAEVAKQLFYNGKSITPLTPGLVRNLRNPMLFDTALKEFSFKTNIPTLKFPPALVRWLFPKEESLTKALVIAFNPLSGSLAPREGLTRDAATFPLQEVVRNWSEVANKVNCSDYLQAIRFGNFQAITHEYGEYFNFEWIEDEVPQYKWRSDWQSADSPSPDAAGHASAEIMSLADEIDEILINIEDNGSFEDMSDYADVKEIEYLPDPMSPFRDRKDVVRTRESNIILDLYKVFYDL